MENVELQQIGAYSITRLLSTSSTQSIYLGRQPQRKKDVLIQFLHAPLTTPGAREAFLAHARSLRRLKHRSIVEVQNADIIQDAQGHEGHDCGYLVMEYITGETLRQHIPSGSRLAPDEVKRIITPIADALQYAHTLGIVHGNLHPGNLLKSARGELFLTNFSLALPISNLTADEQAITLPYTAPEVLQGTPATAGSDQYALAAMAYEWLCGRPPYEATTREALLHQQEHDSIPAPRSLNEAISAGIERVVLQALARDPNDRFPSVYHFSNTYLRTLMGLPVETKTETKVLTSQSFISTTKQDRGKGQFTTRLSFNATNDQNLSNAEEISMAVSKPTTQSTKGEIDVSKKGFTSKVSELICDTCGSTNRSDAKYCVACGRPLGGQLSSPQVTDMSENTKSSASSKLKCSNCGASNRENAKYCFTCRNILQTISQEPINSTSTSSQRLIPNSLLKQRYRLLEMMGQGNYGAVYKAEDTELGNRLVAIKEMLQEGLSRQDIVDATKAFEEEATLLATIKEHVSIPQIYDRFSEAGKWYVVMKFIEGETLEESLNKTNVGCLPVEEVLYIGIQLCAVLKHLHSLSSPIIFRDLKPSNIMRDADLKST